MKGPVHLVLVAYTIEKTRVALVFCERLARQLGVDRRILVLNNPALAEQIDASEWETLMGTNTLGEFSGWQEGLDALGEDRDDACVIFANDTVASHRDFSYFRRLALAAELQASPPNTLIGFVGDAPAHQGSFVMAGLEVESWVGTYIFVLGPEALSRLDCKIWQPEVVIECVPGGAIEDRFFSNAVSPPVQAHLRWFLFAANGWYRAAPLTPDNAPAFAFKARCICAEFLLTARCRQLECEVRDPMRLHPRLRWLDDIAVKWRRRVGRLARFWLSPSKVK